MTKLLAILIIGLVFEAIGVVYLSKGLKQIGYQNYVSLECGCKGDNNVAVPAAVLSA